MPQDQHRKHLRRLPAEQQRHLGRAENPGPEQNKIAGGRLQQERQLDPSAALWRAARPERHRQPAEFGDPFGRGGAGGSKVRKGTAEPGCAPARCRGPSGRAPAPASRPARRSGRRRGGRATKPAPASSWNASEGGDQRRHRRAAGKRNVAGNAPSSRARSRRARKRESAVAATTTVAASRAE